jgi:drug/metabolite transporter (DMT)-like permease
MSARRVGALWTSLGMQAVGAVTLGATLVLLGRWPAIAPDAIPWAVALAITGGLPLYLLYRALALGPVAVVSPVVASYAALVVILVVIFLGERLTLEQTAAVGLVFVGVVLATTDVRRFVATIGRPLPGVRIGVLATLGFAVWGALLAAASRHHDGLTLIVLWRTIAVAMLLGVALVARRPFPLPARPSTLGLIATVGVLDTLGNVAFVLGVGAGQAAITATGSGLYPVVPALLGIWLLGERLVPNQYIGILIVVVGLVALGLRS